MSKPLIQLFHRRPESGVETWDNIEIYKKVNRAAWLAAFGKPPHQSQAILPRHDGTSSITRGCVE